MAGKIVVRKSGIHGKGIFANTDIKKGSIVCIIKGPHMFMLNKNKRDALSNPDWVGFKINHWINPVPPFKYLNHSCNPNSGVKGSVTLVALKNIKIGEEITIDYSITEADTRWYMKCNCKSKNCRGIIKSIQFLPKKIYNKYTPNISKDFRSIYETTNKNK